jgi:hypothetical protein
MVYSAQGAAQAGLGGLSPFGADYRPEFRERRKTSSDAWQLLHRQSPQLIRLRGAQI